MMPLRGCPTNEKKMYNVVVKLARGGKLAMRRSQKVQSRGNSCKRALAVAAGHTNEAVPSQNTAEGQAFQ